MAKAGLPQPEISLVGSEFRLVFRLVFSHQGTKKNEF